LAGYYGGGRGASKEHAAPNLQVTADLAYPWILESYHYIKGPGKVKTIRNDGIDIFLDSGAFSMFTQGIEVNIPAYAKFIHDNQDIIHVASNLDVIGAGNEQGTYDNQKALEAEGVKIQPVHHARDADEWLERYLDEGYDYIFLGGMVPEHTNYLLPWLDRIWSKYLTNPDGTPKIKVHGFGLTTLELMFRYPWFSVDSTSWVMASRFGTLYIDLPQEDGSVKDIRISVSDQSGSIRKLNAHITTLAKPVQDAVRARIEELGYDYELVQTMYGWRDHFNIEYFRRAMDRRVHHFIREQPGLFE